MAAAFAGAARSSLPSLLFDSMVQLGMQVEVMHQLGHGGSLLAIRSARQQGPPFPCVQEGAAGAQEQPVDENKFDEFMGNDAGAFASNVMTYDEDDKEADEVWDQIDEYMDGRRRDR